MRIDDFDPDNMDKDEFLSTLGMGEEHQRFVSSLITKETLSEQEQDKLWEILKGQEHRGFFETFLFDEPLPESAGLFDAERLDQARLEKIRDFIKRLDPRIQPLVEKYKEKHEYFAHAWQEEALKKREAELKEKIKDSMDVWKEYIPLSFDDHCVLNAITGQLRFEGDILTRIPKYHEGNRLFLGAAVKYNRLDVFEKLFDGWETVKILSVLFDWFYNPQLIEKQVGIDDVKEKESPFFYPPLKKKEKLSLLRTYLQSFISTKEEEEAFLHSYMQSLFEHDPVDISIIQFFFPKFNINYSSRNSPNFSTFANIIAEKAALFPIQEFMQLEKFTNYPHAVINEEFEAAIFKRYCELITIKNADEVLLLARYLHRFWLNVEPLPSLLDGFIAPFIKDDDFLIKLLSIPEEMAARMDGFYLYHLSNLIHYNIWFDWFAHWLSLSPARNRENCVQEAKNIPQCKKRLSLSEHILDLIRSYRDEDRDFIQDYTIRYSRPRFLYAFYIYTKNCEDICESRKKLIKELKDFLRTDNSTPDEYKQQCASDVLSPEKPISFFNIFYKRLMEENEDSCLELFTFLELYFCFKRETEVFLSNFPEKAANITERCSKLLGKFRNWKLSEQDYDCVINAARFLAIYHGLWRGLKPLLIAFRNSKRVLLAKDLSSNDRLAHDIMGFFDPTFRTFSLSINDDALKRLRQDMANDFVDCLKPLTPKEKERQAENYTERERAEPGFDIHYKEPSAIWRYAYVRALVDLGVKTDGQGHFLHEVLKKTAENDPAETVRKAAVKADRELNNWREGINGADHKRRLYEAFWWLRLAHLDSLGVDIDRAASKRLRVQEWRDIR